MCAYPPQTSGDVDDDGVVGHLPSETADTPGLFEVSCGDASVSCTATTTAESDSATISTNDSSGDIVNVDDGSSSDNGAAEDDNPNQEVRRVLKKTSIKGTPKT